MASFFLQEKRGCSFYQNIKNQKSITLNLMRIQQNMLTEDSANLKTYIYDSEIGAPVVKSTIPLYVVDYDFTVRGQIAMERRINTQIPDEDLAIEW
jgi:hypothetical protein